MTGQDLRGEIRTFCVVPDEEFDMLAAAGVTDDDLCAALRHWANAWRVKDDWPYIRTVAWKRAVERAQLRTEALAR